MSKNIIVFISSIFLLGCSDSSDNELDSFDKMFVSYIECVEKGFLDNLKIRNECSTFSSFERDMCLDDITQSKIADLAKIDAKHKEWKDMVGIEFKESTDIYAGKLQFMAHTLYVLDSGMLRLCRLKNYGTSCC